MGKRRIRLLQKIDPTIQLIGMDLNMQRTQEASATLLIETTTSLEEALRQADACLVCTAPITHASIIKTCLQANKHVFTELNLVADGYENLMALAKQNHLTLFLSSSMLYRKEIAYITEHCQDKENLTYSYHVGQYLPDWHPWETIENFFVSNKRTNGCRELFAIELPWLIETFGNIIQTQVVQAKKSSLALDYPDTYQVLVTHERGNSGMLWIDVVCRVACRQLKVSSEHLHLVWNGTPDSLTHHFVTDNTISKSDVTVYESVQKDGNYQSSVIENMYIDELLNFLGVMDGTQTPRYCFEKDIVVLDIIDRIEAGGEVK